MLVDSQNAAAERSSRCLLPVNVLAYVREATFKPSEKDFPDGYGNQYSLGGTLRDRMLISPIAMRVAYAKACEEGSGHTTFSEENFPLINMDQQGRVGALTAQLKCCYNAETPFKQRVVFDLDGKDNTKPFPKPLDLAIACRTLLKHFTDFAGNMDEESCIVFFLSYPAKPRSAHVYFPNLCFGKRKSNVLGKAHPLTAEFNKLLEPWGMEGDFSICNSGIRWVFGDKYPPNETIGRAVVGAPTFFDFDCDQMPWREFMDYVDPHVLQSDPQWQREVNWKVIAAPQAAPRHREVIDVDATAPARVAVRGTTFEERVVAAIPQLSGVAFRSVQQPSGQRKLLPLSKFCPFKTQPSDNCAAYEHASPKLYCLCFPNHSVLVKCGVCSDKSLLIEAPNMEMPAIVEHFNKKYARLGQAGTVLALPAPGSDRPPTLLSYNAFINVASDPRMPNIKINKKPIHPCKLWFHSEFATYYEELQFDPGNLLGPSVYNTFTGYNPDVVKRAEELADLTDDELKRRYHYTAKLIRENVCADDLDSFNAFMNFFTDLLINPGVKPRWGICMFGPQGCGKGLSMQFFLKIVGRRHGIHGDSRSLSDHWNAMLVQSLLFFADEGIADKDPKVIGMIKKLITESGQIVRQKFQEDRAQHNNCTRVVVASNNVEAAVIENRDRRWLCMESRYLNGNEESVYFKHLVSEVMKERDGDGPAAFLAYIKRHGVPADFDPNAPVRTKARWNMRLESFTPYERYFYNVCVTGAIVDGVAEPNKMSKHQKIGWNACCVELECDFSELAGTDVTKRGPLQRIPLVAFWIGFQCFNEYRPVAGCVDNSFYRWLYSFLSQETLQVKRDKNANGWHSFVCPELTVLRTAFATYLGQPADKIFDEWAPQ